MPERGIANPEELELLTKAVNDYCERHGIPAGSECDEITQGVIAVFWQGKFDAKALASDIDNVIGPLRNKA